MLPFVPVVAVPLGLWFWWFIERGPRRPAAVVAMAVALLLVGGAAVALGGYVRTLGQRYPCGVLGVQDEAGECHRAGG